MNIPALFLMILVVHGTTVGATLTITGYYECSTSLFATTNQADTWYAAKSFAEDQVMGSCGRGHLPIPLTGDLDACITNVYATDEYIWLSASDRAVEGSWEVDCSYCDLDGASLLAKAALATM